MSWNSKTNNPLYLAIKAQGYGSMKDFCEAQNVLESFVRRIAQNGHCKRSDYEKLSKALGYPPGWIKISDAEPREPLREQISRLGYTVKDFAREHNLNADSLYNAINKQRCSRMLYERIEEALGCKPEGLEITRNGEHSINKGYMDDKPETYKCERCGKPACRSDEMYCKECHEVEFRKDIAKMKRAVPKAYEGLGEAMTKLAIGDYQRAIRKEDGTAEHIRREITNGAVMCTIGEIDVNYLLNLAERMARHEG